MPRLIDVSLRSEPSPSVNIIGDCPRLGSLGEYRLSCSFCGLFSINGALRSSVERELGQAGFV
jgi:hypothetical protein